MIDISIIREIYHSSGSSVEYSVHCMKRMLERSISRADVIDCILTGEIIEDYPMQDEGDGSSLPSCLILGIRQCDDKMIHVVIGYSKSKILIITAYYPDDIHWLSDGKTRR